MKRDEKIKSVVGTPPCCALYLFIFSIFVVACLVAQFSLSPAFAADPSPSGYPRPARTSPAPSPTSTANDIPDDCESYNFRPGLWGDEQTDKQTEASPSATPSPTATVDTHIYACVDAQQLTLVVDNGPLTTNETTTDDSAIKNATTAPGQTNGQENNTFSRSIDGKMILFNQFLTDDLISFGDHKIQLHTGQSTAASLSLNVHSSSNHGIATGAYAGKMICIDFCSKSTATDDPATYIAQNSETCAYNGEPSSPTPIRDSNGVVVGANPGPSPCVLDENSWGFKEGDEWAQDYKPVPDEHSTPYTIINIPTTLASATAFVNYAANTTRALRPGLYGATTIYTLIQTP